MFVFIKKAFYFQEFSMSNICKKVFVLNLKLVAKLVTFYLSADPQAKIKMTLKLLLKTLN